MNGQFRTDRHEEMGTLTKTTLLAGILLFICQIDKN